MNEKKFPIEPFFDMVFVKKDDASIDEDTGFHLPDTIKGRAQMGTVIAAGPGYLDLANGSFYPMQVKVGDRVLLKEFDGYIMRYKDYEFFVFKEKDILGKIIEE